MASCRSMRVSVAEGSTEETAMSGARSSAIDIMAPRSPNFDAQYTGVSACGMRAASETVVMMRGSDERRRSGMTARVT